MVNGYFVAALSGLVLVEAIGLAGELLNLRALSLELPREFAEVYDAETYRRSQTYTRVRTRFGLATSLFHLMVLLAFWLAGGFGWLDGLVRDWGLSPIWTGLVFLLILVVGRGILSLPFSIWGVYVIEEKFGFNRTSPRTFVLDLVKGLGIAVVLGVPLAIGFLALFEYAAGLAWIYAWVAVVAFSFVMQILAPKLIMPLFNKSTPLEDGNLKDAILAYAQRVGFLLKGVFSIDASRRSTKSNAFFTGFGKSRRIALFDTLIQRHSTEELVAVLAHEVGHYKKRHVLIGAVTSALEAGLFLGLFALLVRQTGLFAAFGTASPSFYAGVLFVALLLQPLQFVLSVGAAALSRYHERQADVFAATTTGRADLLADGLRRLSKDNLSNLTPHAFYAFLNYSHPPVLQRVRSLDSDASA